MAIVSVNKPTGMASPANTNNAAMAMVTTLFFMWGFLTCLNDIIIPHLKSIFDLSFAQVMLVQFAFFSAYFIFSLPSGKIVEAIGYKRTMVIGLVTMGVGALGFIPAASVPSFPLFLGALIVLAAGITALQVSANAYVSVLGPENTASSRLNLAQAFNSLGTTIAPLFGGWLILSAAAKTQEQIRALSPDALQTYRVEQASSVKLPYLLIACALIGLGIVIAYFKLPAISTAHEKGASNVNHPSIWGIPHVVLGAIGIFVYVGAEVAIGSFLVNYFNLPNIGNIPKDVAARYLSFYWGGAMVGRFIGAWLLRIFSTGKILGIAALVACSLVTISILTSGPVAMWTIIAVGLFNSIMFPSIFTLGIAGLGPITGEGSGLLIAAIVGGAVIPFVEGVLADKFGVQLAFILPAVCYLYIAFYGFKGSRPAPRRA